jgi:hypothetical protein
VDWDVVSALNDDIASGATPTTTEVYGCWMLREHHWEAVVTRRRGRVIVRRVLVDDE